LIEARCDGAVLSVAGANAPDLASALIYAANKQVAACVHVERSPGGRIRNVDWVEPRESAIRGTGELSTAVIIPVGAPALVLESMSGTVGVVDGKPLFVTSAGWRNVRPRHAAA
jgi:hypothetical protein